MSQLTTGNTITKIILGAIVGLVAAGGVWAAVRLVAQPTDRFESALGVLTSGAIVAVGVWMWRRMP
jgi:energy-converting hydrogenase Eha subunit B